MYFQLAAPSHEHLLVVIFCVSASGDKGGGISWVSFFTRLKSLINLDFFFNDAGDGSLDLVYSSQVHCYWSTSPALFKAGIEHLILLHESPEHWDYWHGALWSQYMDPESVTCHGVKRATQKWTLKTGKGHELCTRDLKITNTVRPGTVLEMDTGDLRQHGMVESIAPLPTSFSFCRLWTWTFQVFGLLLYVDSKEAGNLFVVDIPQF